MLEKYIKDRLKEKDILLMTHIVAGYPDFDSSYRIIEAMVRAGVDLMELQIPFSEPIADGPVILNANQIALRNGSTVKKCLDLAERVSKDFDISFIFMSYYNIIFRYVTAEFIKKSAKCGVKGIIIPDLPPEESEEYITAADKFGISPVFLFSPTTPVQRMNYISKNGRGFIYCVARRGVTGLNTSFSTNLDKYLKDCRKATDLPLALGFGIKEKRDIDFLKKKADIAIIGTETIRLIDSKGIGAVEGFIRSYL